MDPLIQILKKLNDGGVPFVVIGGMAAIVHGAPVTTSDVDVCAPLDHEGAMRIIRALSDVRPKFRTRPDLGVVEPDNINLRRLKNLYLRTDLGVLDVLGAVDGVGGYEACFVHSSKADLGGFSCAILDLDALLAAKQAANRPKDQAAILHLKTIRQTLRDRHDSDSGGAGHQ